MTSSPVVKGKKKREELHLPILQYIVADDWIDKLGHETFCIWLKLHTMVDRTDAKREFDRIPRSFENIYTSVLSISKSKFYRMIKPLWEYGLIDIIEYEDSERKSQKPKNIVIYEYPFHEIERKYMPLEKLRDWDKDYESASKVFGKTGGRPRMEAAQIIQKPNSFKLTRRALHGFKIETLSHHSSKGFKNETVDGFKNKTVMVSEVKPNNYSNNSINLANSFNHSTKEEEEPRVREASELVKYLIEHQIEENNAVIFEKKLLESNLENYTHEQCLKAIDLSLIDFEKGHCVQPYKWAVGKLERILDGRIKVAKEKKKKRTVQDEVNTKHTSGDMNDFLKKNKGKIVMNPPEWYDRRFEPAQEVTHTTEEDHYFKVERMKILLSLNRSTQEELTRLYLNDYENLTVEEIIEIISEAQELLDKEDKTKPRINIQPKLR